MADLNIPQVSAGGVDINALLQANLTPVALNAVTPQIREALGAGLGVAAGLGPTYSLIGKLASGGTPSEQEVIGGLAAAATVVNPLAGAAVLAVGEIAEAIPELLTSLGLLSDAPKPVPYVGLLPKGTPIPAGPKDPTWMPWDKFARFWWPSGSGGTELGWHPGALLGKPNTYAVSSMASGVMVTMVDQMRIVSPEYTKTPGSTADTGVVIHPAASNAFERFLLPVMQKNVEYWANANPYVDPRLLLGAAVKAWNDTHQPAAPGQTMTVPAMKAGIAGIVKIPAMKLPVKDLTYSPQEIATNQGPTSWIEFLLGSGGDSTGNAQRAGAQTVNMGAAVNPPGAGQVVVHQPATNAGPAITYHFNVTTGKTTVASKPMNWKPWAVAAAALGGLVYLAKGR